MGKIPILAFVRVHAKEGTVMETDAAALALTGQLPFVVLAGSIVALPLSLWLLRRYRAAVLRAMAISVGARPISPEPRITSKAAPATRLELLRVGPQVVPAGETGASHALAHRRLGATILSYTAGGVTYAVALAAIQLIADGSFSLLRFVVLGVIHAWPIVIAINLIAPSTIRLKAISGGIYVAVLLGVFLVAIALSTQLSLFDLAFIWVLFDLPATVLLLFFLHRRVRAVGPIVLAFTLISVTGANVALAVVAGSETLLRGFAGAALAIGANAFAAFVSIVVVGIATFAIIGFAANRWIARRYREKRLSDQSLSLDSMWLLFATTQSIGLAFVSPIWFFAGLATFGAYKIVATLSLRLRSAAESATSLKLLYLRVFALGGRSETVFGATSTYWRYIGPVRMIAGPDLAVSTVEPHEFLDYLSGRLEDSFLSDRSALARRMSTLDNRPDPDGRYRVSDFFCRDDTWKIALANLMDDSDCVLMDVRGFTGDSAGVAYELNELINVVPIDRVVLSVDRTTDMDVLTRTLEEAWATMRADSPNRGSARPCLTMCEIPAGNPKHVDHVLRCLCAAAEGKA